MRNIVGLFLLSLLSLALAEERVRYDNYKVYIVYADTEEKYQIVEDVQRTYKLDFWTRYRAGCDIMVPPDYTADFEEFLQENGIDYELTIENVQELIEAEKPKTLSDKFDWTKYETLDKINEWVEGIAQRFPDQVTLFSIGKSYEEREIKGIKISYKEGNKAVFVDACIHAREWIAPAVTTYVIDQLLDSNQPDVRDIAENTDWYFIPVFNVDGYVYSHEVERHWRKNRQPTNSSNCVGTDMNRNFDFHWMVAGSSDSPCDEQFAGPFPQSAPEIDQFVKFIDTLPNDYIRMYITLHSFGQYVLSPWGYTNEFPDNYSDMMHVTKGLVEALKVRYGTVFTYGSVANMIYKASGNTIDWAHGVKRIPIPLTIELRNKFEHGFELPPEQIIPSGEEVLDGFIGMILAAREIEVL